MNSTTASPTTLVPVAPIAFRIASVARFCSTNPCAALATPTPPTTSDRSPASVRNSANRSMFLLKSGETARRERVSQPASGKARLAAERKLLTTRLVGRPGGAVHRHPGRPAHQRSRLNEPGRVQRGLRNQQARPEADADREPVGLAGNDRAKNEGRLAQMKRVADLEVEAGEQSLFRRRAEHAVLFGQRLGRRDRRLSNAAAPIEGHDGSTALTSTSAASPLPARAIARKVAMVESFP